MFPGRGLHFVRDNGDGSRTYGMHLLSCSMFMGQLVTAGDFAALSGDSGLDIFTSTEDVQVAPHYHEGRQVISEQANGNRGFVDFYRLCAAGGLPNLSGFGQVREA